MTTVRIGASKKYAQNFGLAFSQKSKARAKAKKGAQKLNVAGPKKGVQKQAAKKKGK